MRTESSPSQLPQHLWYGGQTGVAKSTLDSISPLKSQPINFWKEKAYTPWAPFHCRKQLFPFTSLLSSLYKSATWSCCCCFLRGLQVGCVACKHNLPCLLCGTEMCIDAALVCAFSFSRGGERWDGSDNGQDKLPSHRLFLVQWHSKENTITDMIVLESLKLFHFIHLSLSLLKLLQSLSPSLFLSLSLSFLYD